MPDDEPALGIVMGVIILIVAGVAVAVWLAPKQPIPHHIYYCCEDNDGFSCAPCRHGIGRPVSVGL